MTTQHILAIGGGGFRPTERYGATPGLLVRHALSLAGTDSPRVCGIYTATGDPDARIAQWYATWTDTNVRASHLALFPMPNVDDIAAHLLAQDAVYVGGGSVANLLALWRLHGVDDAVKAAYDAGVVFFGVSAGSLCWFTGGTTDSFGPELQPVTDGLGLLPGSHCPHYDGEERRRPTYQALIRDGVIDDGLAADDGVGLHFADGVFVEAVADRSGASAWRVERDGAGGVRETEVAARLLT